MLSVFQCLLLETMEQEIKNFKHIKTKSYKGHLAK